MKDHLKSLLFNLRKAKAELLACFFVGDFLEGEAVFRKREGEEVWGGSGERALIQALCPAKRSMWVLT